MWTNLSLTIYYKINDNKVSSNLLKYMLRKAASAQIQPQYHKHLIHLLPRSSLQFSHSTLFTDSPNKGLSCLCFKRFSSLWNGIYRQGSSALCPGWAAHLNRCVGLLHLLLPISVIRTLFCRRGTLSFSPVTDVVPFFFSLFIFLISAMLKT